MKLSKEHIAGALPVFFAVLMIALCRLLPHPWNFVPVSASAIFGGIYLNKKWAFFFTDSFNDHCGYLIRL